MPTRSVRRKEARSRRRRRLLGGALSVTVCAAGAFALLSSHALSSLLAGGGSGTANASNAALVRTASPCPAAPGAATPAAGATPAGTLLIACPAGTAGPVSLAPPSPGPGQQHKPRPAHRRAPRPTAPASPAASPAAAGTASAAAQVLAVINQARAQAGLPPYTLSAGLNTSASAHNTRMAAGCGLSHQCPGEPSLGARETAAGVRWTAAGENIGEGGPEPATASAIARMAVTLTQDMLNEQPPNDGHKLNILSSTFRHIGIAVVRDSGGTVWMTQDFSS